MSLSFESKVALVTAAADASATVAMTHIAIPEALNGTTAQSLACALKQPLNLRVKIARNC
jgi:hypothetical protein